MKKLIFLLITICLVSYSSTAQTSRIKVACVGNSITEGVGSSDKTSTCYVAVLGQLLGEQYEVGNFGVSGATGCRNTHKPYDKCDRFEKAKAFQPDIVTIALGTNDSQPKVWNTADFAKNFKSDLMYLCQEFETLASRPKIYLCLPIPIIPSERWAHQPDVLANEIIPIIREIAKEKGYGLIDLHTPLIGKKECYPKNDMLHPNDLGHKQIAKLIYSAIRTN